MKKGSPGRFPTLMFPNATTPILDLHSVTISVTCTTTTVASHTHEKQTLSVHSGEFQKKTQNPENKAIFPYQHSKFLQRKVKYSMIMEKHCVVCCMNGREHREPGSENGRKIKKHASLSRVCWDFRTLQSKRNCLLQTCTVFWGAEINKQICLFSEHIQLDISLPRQSV